MSGSISTVAIHADRDVHPSRAVAPPICQTATFWAEDAEQFAQAAADRRGQGFYTRFGNPNHAQVAAVVAEALKDHSAVARVHYPGLATHPQHALAHSQMSGFGRVPGIELAGGFGAADAFLGRLRYVRRAASLGGVESLAVHPASMWRGMLSQEQIAASGVPLGLIRLAAGTEDTAGLVADALAAADAVAAAPPRT
jgi:methionine-gamma-lyase